MPRNINLEGQGHRSKAKVTARSTEFIKKMLMSFDEILCADVAYIMIAFLFFFLDGQGHRSMIKVTERLREHFKKLWKNFDDILCAGVYIRLRSSFSRKLHSKVIDQGHSKGNKTPQNIMNGF